MMKFELICEEWTPSRTVRHFLEKEEQEGYCMIKVTKTQPKGKNGRRGSVKIEYYYLVKDGVIMMTGAYIGQHVMSRLWKHWDGNIYDAWMSVLNVFDMKIGHKRKMAYSYAYALQNVNEKGMCYDESDFALVGNKNYVEREFEKHNKTLKKAVQERNEAWKIYHDWRSWMRIKK